LADLTRAGLLFISLSLIISFKATRESTLFDKSPYFSW
jgi:hypothetical protein